VLELKETALIPPCGSQRLYHVRSMPRMLNGICSLCDKQKLLSRSHIIPELHDKYIYENNQIIMIDGDVNKLVIKQKGERDHLLCAKCENDINHDYEQPYFSQFHAQLGQIHYDTNNETSVFIKDISKFKMFHYTVLWRMMIAKTEMWESLSTSPLTLSLKESILNNDPTICDWLSISGAIIIDEYGINSEFGLSKPIIQPALDTKICYSIWGGVEWFYTLGRTNDPMIIKSRINKNGFNSMALIPFTKSVTYNYFMKHKKVSRSNQPLQTGAGDE